MAKSYRIIDLFNRKGVGWSLSKELTSDNSIEKNWNIAIKNTTLLQPLIFHSDRGVQYASQRCASIIKSQDGVVLQSMSRKGNCWDSAVADFFKSLKVEWVYRRNYKLRPQAELFIFEWIETWYNNKRRHSFLGNRTIKEFELDINNHELAV